MKTVRTLIYRDVVWSIVFVAIAFMSLFFFIDFLEELERATRKGSGVGIAALTAALSLPYRFYELAPDRKSTRLNSSHSQQSRMPSSA